MTIEQRILYEDNHLLALNKQTGELVQGDSTGDEALSDKLKRYLKERDAKPGEVFLGVPHRIDRPVSGVVLFAKTSKALERLNELIRTRGITKKYWAVTQQKPNPESGQLKHYLLRNDKINKSFPSLQSTPGAKEALLHYRYLCSCQKYHLIEIELITGRHHQIRAQFSAIGCPIKGDLKYGAPRSNPNGGISLHARSLSFIHPVQKVLLEIVAPAPATNPFIFFPSIQPFLIKEEEMSMSGASINVTP